MKSLFIASIFLLGYSAFGQQQMKLRDLLYSCKYSTHPLVLRASNVSMKVQEGGSVCLAATHCVLTAIVENNDDGKYPPEYDSWVACLPDENGYCPLDEKVCSDDQRVGFADATTGKVQVKKVLDDQKKKEPGATK